MLGLKFFWTRRAEQRAAAEAAEIEKRDAQRDARRKELERAQAWLAQPSWPRPMPTRTVSRAEEVD